MKKKPMRVAFYGKGGIGKSTVAANLSACMAQSGHKVLHIGCDPKSDSTRLLTGDRIPTVLQSLNGQKSPLGREQVVFPGAFGVACVEAGGPAAGTGCAGLGISAMVEELERLEVLDEHWDIIVYDVLGDVVCGGFAVPMRKHFVDSVYLVTSGEYMSLYAANNILRAVAGYSRRQPMLGGILHNRVQEAWEQELVENFVRRTNSRLLGIIPEASDLRAASCRQATLAAAAPQSDVVQVFQDIAQAILLQKEATRPLPLDDEALEKMCQDVIGEEASFD